jgi:hypothetical protein
MVYPSLIATVSDASHPSWRARSLSVYRFWRDLGYAVAALSAGVIADILGILWAVGSGGRSRLGVRSSSRIFRHHCHQGHTKRERRKRRSLSLPQGISPLQLFECYYFLAFGPLYSILLVAVLDALSVPLTAEPDCAKVSVAFAAPSASWSSAVVLMFLMSSQAWW